jgi:hypothetical protein
LVDISLEVLGNTRVKFCQELQYLFVAHCILLPKISVRERARSLEQLNPQILHVLLDLYLPALFLSTARCLSLTSPTVPFDIDGRVFCSLIRFFTIEDSKAIPMLVGQSIYATLEEIWSQIGSPPLALERFAQCFPHEPLGPLSVIPPSSVKPFRLLPFDNKVFNAELALVNVPVSDTDELQSSTHVEFCGRGMLFSDTQHWHSQKSLLPSYLGGSDPKHIGERARLRALRQDQRFMATMQAQAATLIGASGGSLKPIVIPPVGTTKAPQKNRRPSMAVIKVRIPYHDLEPSGHDMKYVAQ